MKIDLEINMKEGNYNIENRKTNKFTHKKKLLEEF